MKIASNKAFYTYGAQSAPRATADVGDTCMKRLTILIFVWAIFFCASTAFCEIPNEYRDLLKDNIHIRYYCPRCGRTLDLDAEKNTAMVKEAGEYTGLVDRYAGVCNPHRWEYASSLSSHGEKTETRSTNALGEVTISHSGPMLACGEGHWQFKGFARIVGKTPEFISAINALSASDPDLCRRIIIWFSSCPPIADDYAEYINSWFDDEETKTEAALAFITIMSNTALTGSTAEMSAWLEKYKPEKNPQQEGPGSPPQGAGSPGP